MSRNAPLMLGAVAYAPKVVTIWEGFKSWFAEQGLAIDYLLYSNYETQVEAQFAGDIAFAWNSPLAWIRARRMAEARGESVQSLVMRDTDIDMHSVLIVRSESHVKTLADLRDTAIGFGAIDSPQATLIPLDHLRHEGGIVAERDYRARRFDVLGGKHGDHIGGERDAARALVNGEIDAAWMIAGNYKAFADEGTLPAGGTRIVATTGAFDHCNMTVSPGVAEDDARRFGELLMAMDWNDASVRPLLELEGLRRWLPGRASGYALLDRAVTEEAFYDDRGRIIEPAYRY
ncbi:phosphate/phosphite/phosphonate ABC transporter substrate-binding protein [Paraburkholderia tropica]|uniref:ABC-type phosphate/phosphonate transport system substrate-binding protein n=1 Tax=Paraburkholderia tropica TaxID=92647 RepID=A0ABX5MK17_9BURK|nr:PhnD/SsuA/transferrin family substrate-binding protein [Paraburkholderia tropica]MDE1138291.1 PhnD/SsuA/transferrin family substrate-binding protein [Paraburkholderia tropica]PXX11682.1 ABC-type phosphate/phosphonate transport system substrate-binding protein [Paraburkholderia tropica]PZW77091.1 ABC-type phosphate/phosphonate transport system substrate-binding protein [Paraburkholderia tropica]